jgi:hypothetical protein
MPLVVLDSALFYGGFDHKLGKGKFRAFSAGSHPKPFWRK